MLSGGISFQQIIHIFQASRKCVDYTSVMINLYGGSRAGISHGIRYSCVTSLELPIPRESLFIGPCNSLTSIGWLQVGGGKPTEHGAGRTVQSRIACLCSVVGRNLSDTQCSGFRCTIRCLRWVSVWVYHTKNYLQHLG